MLRVLEVGLARCAPARDAAVREAVVRDDTVRPVAAPFKPVVRDAAEAVLVAVRRGDSLNVVASGDTTATVLPYVG